MSEQPNALSFGPQWIRDLSNGTSMCAPPPSPGPKYNQNDHRYGKEEMLAIFSKHFSAPDVGELADFILKKHISEPLACIPMTEEEVRMSYGSLNSAAVLKMMGRGAQRGGRGTSRGGRGAGRGSGGMGREGGGGGGGGFYRGFSTEETSSKTDESWQRDAASKRLSWGENGRGGFERPTSREPGGGGGGGNISGSGGSVGEVTSPSYRQPSRALSSGNWRSSESGDQDDGGGWMVSGGSQRADKWRGSGRGWHGQDSRDSSHQGGGGGYGDSWKRGRRSSDEVPEWSRSDNVFEPDGGTFDSSGAFLEGKEQIALNDTGQSGKSSETKEDWDAELENEKHENVTDSSQPTRDKNLKEPSRSVEATEKIVQEETKGIEEEKRKTNSENKVEKSKSAGKTDEKLPSLSTNKQKDVVDASLSPSEAPVASKEHVQDEIGAHLERVAESCIANLDVEAEEHSDRQTTDVNAKVERSSPVVEEKMKWFYCDPQGQEQGPFRNEEMVEWFHHGYFTMQLQIRRQCDVMYLPLGEIMKRWQRVPFLPGPSPPPITHQQLMSEQEILRQQLLQQHYQQLQKQVILQQLQQQQRRVSPTVESPTRPLSNPRPGNAAETIWGSDQSPESPKGPWSPVSSTAPIWDTEKARQKSPVPSAEEVQKMAEEKAQQEQLRVQKEREEEEARREKERRLQEIQIRQAEMEQRKQEAVRQQKEAEERQKKENAEQKREQQRQALLRLQQQQELQKQREQQQAEQERERQRQEEEKQRMHEKQRRKLQEQERIMAAEQQRKQQLLVQEQQQQRRENERNNEQNERKKVAARWASPNATTLSLSEIQKQEEVNRRAHEEKMRELEARQRQLQQQNATNHGWADKQAKVQSSVKSLKTIQDEQARQQQQQRNKQTKQTQQRSTTQPVSSGAWPHHGGGGGDGWSISNNNIWAGEREEEAGFWDEAARSVTTQPEKTPVAKTRQTVPNGKKTSKKSTKEEENVRRIFQPASSGNDPFTEWCEKSLAGLATSVDVPTFVTFLKEVDSPYEIHDYVKDFFGESSHAKTFAKEFIERKRAMKARDVASNSGNRSGVVSKSAAPPALSGVVARGAVDTSTAASDGGTAASDGGTAANGKGKKKRRQKMQKVDPRILGFSVNAAAERVNMGEIQSIDDIS